MFRAFGTKFQIPRILYAQHSSFSTKPVMQPPFTAENLQAQRQAFRSMPSFNPNEQTIKTCDYFRLFDEIRKMGFNRTTDQVEHYVKYSTALGGKIDIVKFTNYMSKFHDPKLLIQENADSFDRDKDGFISADEYDLIVRVMASHDPSINLLDYKKFLEEADTNKDGKVSVRELQLWACK